MPEAGTATQGPAGPRGASQLEVAARGARGALRYARLLLAAAEVYRAINAGCSVTLRDLYYRRIGSDGGGKQWGGSWSHGVRTRPVSPCASHQPPSHTSTPHFAPTLCSLKACGGAATPAQASAAVVDLTRALGVPREALGVIAAPRGAAGGALHVNDGAGGGWSDVRRMPRGLALPGDPAAVRRLGLRTPARFLVVVEKEATFQRLLEDRLWEAAGGCVLVTGRGWPDIATRAFVAHARDQCPHLIVLGGARGGLRVGWEEGVGCVACATRPPPHLPHPSKTQVCDWNPAGAGILAIYRHGSARAGAGRAMYAQPDLGWLGARRAQLLGAPPQRSGSW